MLNLQPVDLSISISFETVLSGSSCAPTQFHAGYAQTEHTKKNGTGNRDHGRRFCRAPATATKGIYRVDNYSGSKSVPADVKRVLESPG